MSFYTIALLLTCLLCFCRQRCILRDLYVLPAVYLTAGTLLAKAVGGYSADNSYILFVLLLFLFPLVTKENRGAYDFYSLTVFFAIGIIAAALSALCLRAYPSIAQYITVSTYGEVTRYAGYYGDPNFYSAHISAALGGVLVLILREKQGRQHMVLIALAVVLLYCGFLSVSKAFALIAFCMLLLFAFRIFCMRDKSIVKVTLLLAAFVAGTIALSSDILAAVGIRFSEAKTVSDLTTGRSEIWKLYLDAIVQDGKMLLIGQGFTNIKLDGHSAHNTVIQMLYQFGILGSVPMILWIRCFVQNALSAYKRKAKSPLCVVLLLLGTIGPWMSVDILFFDEFFLLLFYVCVGVGYLRRADG